MLLVMTATQNTLIDTYAIIMYTLLLVALRGFTRISSSIIKK